jgi:hypothetical protein
MLTPCDDENAVASAFSLQKQEPENAQDDSTAENAAGVPLLLPQEGNANAIKSIAALHFTSLSGLPSTFAPSLQALPAPVCEAATRTDDTRVKDEDSVARELLASAHAGTPAQPAAENLIKSEEPGRLDLEGQQAPPAGGVPSDQGARRVLDIAASGSPARSSDPSIGKRTRKPSSKAIEGDGVSGADLKSEAASNSERRKTASPDSEVIVTSDPKAHGLTPLKGKDNRIWLNGRWHRMTAEGALVIVEKTRARDGSGRSQSNCDEPNSPSSSGVVRDSRRASRTSVANGAREPHHALRGSNR